MMDEEKASRQAVMNKIHTLVKCLDMNSHSEVTTILIAGNFVATVSEKDPAIRKTKVSVLASAMSRLGPIGMEMMLLMTSMVDAAEKKEKNNG